MSGTVRYPKGTVVTPHEAHDYWQQLVNTENTLTSRYRKNLPTIGRSHAGSALSTSMDGKGTLEKVARKRNFTFSTDLHSLLTSSVNSKLVDSSPRRIPIPSTEKRLRSTHNRPLFSQCDYIPSPERPAFHPDSYYSKFAGPNCLKPNQLEPNNSDLEHILDTIKADPRLSAFEKTKKTQAVLRSRRERGQSQG